MRTFYRRIRWIAGATLFFFVWSFLPAWQIAAWAASPEQRKTPQARNEKPKQVSVTERFQAALDEIREQAGQMAAKADRGEDDSAEMNAISAKKAEIDGLAGDIRAELAATETKLKTAGLPKEILDRHHRFATHFEDNLRTLKTNLDDVETSKTKADRKAKIEKARLHLEKVKPPKKHVPLDPNKLPNRMVKAKARAPRLKKEEFEKDFPPQKKSAHSSSLIASNHELKATSQELFYSAFRTPQFKIQRKPILIAANGPLTGLLSSNPKPVALPFTDNDLSSGINPAATFLDSQSAITHEPRAILLAASTLDLPTSDDLMETIEVKFTNEIKEVTSLLNNDPVSIYEFVKNTFEYEPYYGSLKGSQQTLFEQAGNDFDQASLLIDLYRSIGIPARYVYGTINLPIDKAISWLGAPDAQTAVKLLASNGVPVARNASGAITNIQVEHVWIEAFLPYDNYRGKINSQDMNNGVWISLDPSFKAHIKNPSGINPYIASNISIETIFQSYQSQIKTNLPVQEYLSSLKSNIEQTMPDKRFYDLVWTNTIDGKELGLLPNTLEYESIIIGGKFSEIQDSSRHKIRFTTSNDSTSLSFEDGLFYTANLPDIVGKRITISYIPATSMDANIIYQYGNIYNTPPYLIQIKPVLKIDGQIKATGEPIGMGVPHELSQTILTPGGIVEDIVTFPIVSGAYYAIGLDPQKMPTKILYWRADKYLQVLNSATASTERDDIVGELLHLLMTGYLEQKDMANKFIAETMQFRDVKKTTVAILGIGLSTSYAFSMPVRCDLGSMIIDVKREISNPIDISGSNRPTRDFMIMFGMNASFLESSIFETIFGIEGVSTLKALALANTTGVPIYKINQTNSNVYLPLLQVSDDVRNNIVNALSQGKQITVSQKEIQLNKWRGVGYIIENAETGEAAYMISGGLAGGFLTDVIQAFKALMIQDPSLNTGVIQDKIKKLINDRKVQISNPVAYQGFIKSPWGNRFHPIDRVWKFHDGIDISVETGTKVMAVADGKVRVGYDERGYGYYIVIDHGLGFYTRYAHLSAYVIDHAGVEVKEGDIIALSGSTGKSSGPHLHFSVYIGSTAAGSSIDPQGFPNIM